MFAALLALPLIAGAALAAKGSVTGSEMQGYGRLVFSFDQETVAKVRVVNAVMIIEFESAVALDLERLAQQIPNYVSVARLDPDGKSIRLGMVNRFRPDLKPAGEKLFLDLLPPRWQGLPPSLPTEVVQDLARRARTAEDRLRLIERERDRRVPRDLELSVGSTPLFRRAIFAMPKTVPVEYREQDGAVLLTFDSNFEIKPELIRARLAGLISDVAVEENEATLRIALRLAEGITVRGFREDDAFTLDFARADGQPIDRLDPPAAAPKTGAQPGAQQKKEAAAASPEAAREPADASRPPTLIKGVAVPEPPIDTRFEPGRDAEGFALRIANLKKAPVAILPRGNQLLVLIETPELPNMPSVPDELRHNVEGVSVTRVRGGALMLISPRKEGEFWLTRSGEDLMIQRGKSALATADGIAGAAIGLRRAFDNAGKESLEAVIGQAGRLHVIDDPASGKRLHVVPVPDVGFASDKARAFAEFSIERTLSGFAVLPLDEAVTVTRLPASVMIGHEIRLNLSSLPPEVGEKGGQKALMLDPELWQNDTRGAVRISERRLLQAAAEAPKAARSAPRLRLARFYLANGLNAEAAGVLDVIAADDAAAAQSKAVLFHRALAAALMGHIVEANRLLAEPALAIEAEQRLLQAMVDTQSLRYAQAVANFKQALDELARYPESLQAIFRKLAVEAAIEAQDPAFGREQLLAYEGLDVAVRNPHLQQLLGGRLAEMQGRHADAYTAYALAARSTDREIEAKARFGKASAGLADGKIAPEDAKAEFETLSAIWRKSEIELKSLARLSEIYAAEGRWREAFLASQRATAIMPDHPVTRQMEEAMGRRFEAIFLDGESGKLSKVEALALYQEFRTLVPPGRRGDEIARRLADRLYDLDLVGEAAEILEHQVKKRLDGVARASVAARLALMHLANREPARALSIIRETRLANIPNDLRRARNLLEAKALGELQRTELAIEILANDEGEDVERLRADIYWKGKKWREAGERYEKVLGEAWQGPEPLNESQRLDALRAGLAYVIGEETLSLDRLRSKYLTKMSKSEDAGAFNLITIENFSNPAAFRDVARNIVNADTMTEFLASYRRRYPETSGQARPIRSAGEGRQSAAPAPGRNG